MMVDDRELAEVLDFQGRRPRLTLDEADRVLESLNRFEDDIFDAFEWGGEPALFIARGHYGPVGLVNSVTLSQVPLPAHRWSPDPAGVLVQLAERVEQMPVVCSLLRDTVSQGAREREFIGMVFRCGAYSRKPGADLTKGVNDHPELRADEVHVVYAADVDERQYCVMRFRKTGERLFEVRTSQSLERQIRENQDQPELRWIVQTHKEGLPRIPRALRTLVRAIREQQ